MNRLAYILSFSALVAFGACSDNAEETIITEKPAEESIEYRTYVEIDASASAEQPAQNPAADTRASYDADLAAYWEEGDQINVMQGYAAAQNWQAGHKNVTKYAEPLTLSKGAGTSSANFSGTITTYDSKAGYFHFAYPASQSVMSTTTDNPLVGSVTNTTTCDITIPAEQDGRWMPFMFASTDTQTTVGELHSVKFRTLNGAVALRVYESDGKTPKQIRAVTITADTDIVGTYHATTPNNGALTAEMFSFEGGGRTITAQNLESVEPLNGLCEYRFEVAAVTVGGLTIEVEAADGSTVTRTAYPNGKTFEPRKRSGLNIVWDAASITDGNATSWFDDYATDNLTSLAPNTLYIGEARLYGYGPTSVTATGFVIEYPDGTVETIDTGAGITSFGGGIERSGLASGDYKVYSFADTADGTHMQSGTKNVHVTPIPAIASADIRTSYSRNGATELTNDIAGDEIRAAFSLNDPYTASLIASASLNYGTSSADIAADTQNIVEGAAWGTYDSSINVTMSNGYALSSAMYPTTVSGIPYTAETTSATPDGWSTNNTDTNSSTMVLKAATASAVSPRFHIPGSCGVSATISAYAYGGSLPNRYKPSVYLHAGTTASATGEATVLSGSNALVATASFGDITRTLEFNSSVSNLCIYANGSKPTGSIGASIGVVVRSVSVKYDL